MLGFLFLIADAAVEPSGSWVAAISGIASGLGGGGFAIWYAWHTTTKTIPDLAAKHEATIRAMQDAHAAVVSTLTKEFHAGLKEAWSESKETREAFRKESVERRLEMQSVTAVLDSLCDRVGYEPKRPDHTQGG